MTYAWDNVVEQLIVTAWNRGIALGHQDEVYDPADNASFRSPFFIGSCLGLRVILVVYAAYLLVTCCLVKGV